MSQPTAVGKPILVLDIHLPVETLPKDRQWAGLDRGCSLTKILYISRSAFENPKRAETRTFSCALFTNKDFEHGISWLKKEAHLPKEMGPLYVTGAGGASFRKWIGEQLGLEALFQDEFLSQIRGSHYMVEHIEEAEICFPSLKVVKERSGGEIPAILEEMQKFLKDHIPADKASNGEGAASAKFPAIFAFMGSGGGFTKVNADGTGKIVGGVTFAGKTFLGLGKALLDTADYGEICDLAEKGDRRKIDESAEEVFDDGSFPAEVSVGCFGRLADSKKSLKEYDRADLAHALVAMTTKNIVAGLMLACANEKISKVYIGGNLVRSDIMRREIEAASSVFFAGSIDIKILRSGHTGAIGAMIATKEDHEKFFQLTQEI